MRRPAPQIRSLPSLSIWFCCIISIAVAAFAIALLWLPASPSDSYAPEKKWAISISSALLFGGLGLLVVGCGMCREIVADEAGLRWRMFPGIGAWKTSRCEEVTDYYLADTQSKCVVQTERGTLTFEKSNRKNADALCDFITERSSRAVCREWKERGSRPGEPWPIIFEYGSEDAYTLLGLATVIALPTLSFTGFGTAETVRHVLEHGWTGNTTFDVIVGTGVFLLFEGVAALMAASASKSLFRRDRIAVDEHGIAWIRDDGIVEAGWPQVRSVHPKGLRYVVETTSAEIEISGLLKDSHLLHRLIQRFAADAVARGKQEHPNIALLVGAPEVRPGSQVFVYRTKLNFLMACIPTFFMCMCLVGSLEETVLHLWPEWDARFSRSTPTEIAFMGVAAALFALLSAWLWWRLFTGKVIINADSITQHGPFGVHSVKWKDVRSVTTWKRIPPFFFYVIHGPSSRLTIWTSISDVLELETEINRHIPDHIPKVRALPAICYDDSK